MKQSFSLQFSVEKINLNHFIFSDIFIYLAAALFFKNRILNFASNTKLTDLQSLFHKNKNHE